jgi:hypothetical protein
MTTPIWQPLAEEQTPPTPPGKKRHWVRWTLAGAGATVLAFTVIGIAIGGSTTGTPTVQPSSSAPAVAAPVVAPVPTASPDGTYSGTCDVSLSSSLYGQDYLTADVTLTNTGNVGTHVAARASWGQQGFEPIHMTRIVKVAAGGSRTVHFHYAATTEQISRFQDVQLASTGDGCTYQGTIIDTFGQVH